MGSIPTWNGLFLENVIYWRGALSACHTFAQTAAGTRRVNAKVGDRFAILPVAFYDLLMFQPFWTMRHSTSFSLSSSPPGQPFCAIILTSQPPIERLSLCWIS
ncbi:hypothetical protein TNCV_324901 [Trichonephila clavipes]|nr:hypothetical protein TNCV_324901 [Trichonephila clavipes]